MNWATGHHWASGHRPLLLYTWVDNSYAVLQPFCLARNAHNLRNAANRYAACVLTFTARRTFTARAGGPHFRCVLARRSAAALSSVLLDPPALSLPKVLRVPPERFWFTVGCGVLPQVYSNSIHNVECCITHLVGAGFLCCIVAIGAGFFCAV